MLKSSFEVPDVSFSVLHVTLCLYGWLCDTSTAMVAILHNVSCNKMLGKY